MILREELIASARELEARGYERGPIVDISRRDELLGLYEEMSREVVVLDGAVPEEGRDCTECLGGPDLVTFFVKPIC